MDFNGGRFANEAYNQGRLRVLEDLALLLHWTGNVLFNP